MIRRIYLIVHLLIYLLCSLSLLAQTKIIVTQIDGGVIHKKITNLSDTLSINILIIDLTSDRYYLSAIKANNLLNAKESTSNMAESLIDSGYNVIAAINADFFESDGEVINNMISEGEYVKAVKFTDSPFSDYINSQFAVTYNNKLLLEHFIFSGSIIFHDGNFESIKRINSLPDSNSISLFNRYEGVKSTELPDNLKGRYYLLSPIVSSADTQYFQVTKVIENPEKFSIGKSELLLSANGKYAEYLKRDLTLQDTLKIVIRLTPYFGQIRTLTGGWPRLVKDGENVIKKDSSVEGIFPRFSLTKHPRTGIGFSKDSTVVYFITVDGRQESSSGMSLKDFADLMIDEGIYQGLNLDGGGSTTMWINGNVVNKPSDITGERPVGNCIVLIKKR